MVYDLFLLLFSYSPFCKIPYYSLAIFTTTLTEISYIKSEKKFKTQNLCGGRTKTLGGPHAPAGRWLKTPALYNTLHVTVTLVSCEILEAEEILKIPASVLCDVGGETEERVDHLSNYI
jgi:hypothetical protein